MTEEQEVVVTEAPQVPKLTEDTVAEHDGEHRDTQHKIFNAGTYQNTSEEGTVRNPDSESTTRNVAATAEPAKQTR